MKYELPGEPIPWKAHKGYGRRSYSPNHARKQADQWEIMVQQEDASPHDTCVRLILEFHMPIPKSMSKKMVKRIESGDRIYHRTRPDLTNLQKYIEDCLTGIVITDDNLVVDIRSTKFYAINPKTVVEVEEI